MMSGSALFELPELLGDVAEGGVLPVELREHGAGPCSIARLLERVREVVAQALVFLVAAAGRCEAFLEPLHREPGHALLEEADAEHARALEQPLLVLRRQLEL